MTINNNQNQSKRSIGREILLNYVTYASDDTNEINVNDLLEFIEARSVVTTNENNKNTQNLREEFEEVFKAISISA